MMKKIINKSLTATYAALIIVLFAYTIIKVHGFSYNATDRSLTQTGVLDIKSNVSHASIYINGNRFSESTPAIIWLNPGQYQLNIKKPGYHEWLEEIEITTKEAIQRNITLIPLIKDSSVSEVSKSVDLIAVNANQSKLALVENANKLIRIVSTTDFKEYAIIKTGANVKQ
jgi:hypothetical protein